MSEICKYSITCDVPIEPTKKFVSRSGDLIAKEIGTCTKKDMGIEMTCDSIDDQDNVVEMCDRDDIVDQNCLCGGISFFYRRQ